MIRLASIIEQFEGEFLSAYNGKILPSQFKALHVLKKCRSDSSPLFKISCADCDEFQFVPHSCGHRSCPHCQHHESQQWIDQQLQKHVPANYFMITFTLPKELRSLAWQHQKVMYQLLFQCAWDTLSSFSANDKKLKGTPGVVAVLHTHSRQLNFHPHVHAVMPAAVIDKKHKHWRQKEDKYLFNHRALAKVFRAKILAGLTRLKLEKPKYYPQKWVVDVQSVGAGDKALIYLGRYLYRGVIQEKDILSVKNGKVTFRYLESKTKQYKTITLSGVQFLWRVLQHVLPKGFRRARNYGFLHPNSKRLVRLIQLILKSPPMSWIPKKKPRSNITCHCCGGAMHIVQTRIKRKSINLAPT
jgi:Zn ribbon nucleic-acid-binding protein